MKEKFKNMINKLCFQKIKIVNYFRIYKLKIDNQKYGYLYIILIILSVLFSIVVSKIINITYDENMSNLFIDTGIALIGLSAIIFTLQIFNQEARNKYTNSVMEKIIDIKFQHIIEYVYIIGLVFIFLLVPRTCFFESNINIFLPYFYLSIFNIFVMLGIDLFISSNLTNKRKLIIILEKRINYILDSIENQYNDIESYSKKIKSYNPPLHEYIARSSKIFSSYIQCINSLLRTSIDDPILFENGMEAYIEIIKNRLSKRKNKFNYVNIPYFNEIIPNTDNDSFIEKYMLEYLNEYAKIALENRNRDILQIIQRTYHQFLIIGKNNTYSNSETLELTVKITFIYYLEVVKMIIKMNNENMLFDTVEIFKDLFVNNKDAFYDLIDNSFYEFITDSIDIAIENKSLMNYRNLLLIAILPIHSLITKEDRYNYIRIEPIFKSIKNSIFKSIPLSALIKHRDGARLYYQYIFNSMDPQSLSNYFIYYFNNIIVSENNKDTKNIYENIKLFVDFYTSNEIIEFLKFMDNNGRFVTGFVDFRYILAVFAKAIFKMLTMNEYKEIHNKLKSLLKSIFGSFNNAVIRHNSNGMRISELDDFYNDDLNNVIGYEEKANLEIKKLYFDSYYNSLILIYDNNIKSRRSILDYHEFIDLVYKYCEDDKYIINLVNWYCEKVNCNLTHIINEYNDLSSYEHLGINKLDYKNKERLKAILYNKIESSIKECSKEVIDKTLSDLNIQVKKRLSINEKVNTILNSLKK